MALPRPGCAGWFAGAMAVALALVLALAGGAAGHAGHDHGASPSPAPAGSIAIAHILVAPLDDAIAAAAITDEAAWASAQAEAVDLRSFVETQPGDVFALVASQSSDDLVSAFDGGHLGVVTAGGATSAIPASVVEAVRALADPVPGTVLGPIRSPIGWHIVRIEDPAAVPVEWPASRPIEPAVILLDPGAEPRQLLRFAPPAGATTAISVSAWMTTTRSPDTGSALDLGGASLVGTWTVTATDDPDGAGTRLDLVLDQVTVLGFEGDDDEAIARATDLLTGTQASLVIAPNGIPVSSAMELPDGLDPVLAQAVRRSVDGVADSVGTYPDEPVGSGARWSTVREIPGLDGEVGTLISTRSVLSAIDDTRLQLASATSRIDVAGMAQGPGTGAAVKLGESEQSIATRTVTPGTFSFTTHERANGVAWFAPLGGGGTVTRTVVAQVDIGPDGGG